MSCLPASALLVLLLGSVVARAEHVPTDAGSGPMPTSPAAPAATGLENAAIPGPSEPTAAATPAAPDTAPLPPAPLETTPAPAPKAPPAAPPKVEGAMIQMVVTGTRTPRRVTDDPIGTEVIGAREMAARNVRDTSRALEGEPGIQTERSFRGASFQLRGLDAKYVRILVDGMPAVGQVNDVIDLRRFGVEGIERIEVVRGAASALYGSDALAGVINLISKRPRRALEATVFAQYSPTREVPLIGNVESTAAGGSIGTRQGDLSGTLSFNWFGNDSYTLYAGNPTGLPTNGDSRSSFQGTGRFAWEPSDKFELSGFVRGGGFESRGVDLQLPTALFNRQVSEREFAGGSTARWTPDEATRITLLAQGNGFWRTFHRKQRQGPGEDDQVSFESLGRTEVQADHTFQKGLTGTLGLGGQYGRFESLRIADGLAQVVQGWAFGQVEWKPVDAVDLVGGVRADFDSNFGSWASPRLAARVKADAVLPGLAFRSSYGQGFRAPSFGERYLDFNNTVANYRVMGNAALRPETSFGGQLGAEWTPPGIKSGPVPTLRLTGHYTSLSNLIQAVETSDSTMAFQQFQYANYAKAHTGGVEASLRVIWDDFLVGDLGYTWLDTRGTVVVGAPERTLPGRAARQVTASLIASHPDWGTEASMRNSILLGRSALADDVTLPNIVLSDLRFGQRLWKSAKGRSELQVYLQVDNVFDVREPEFLSLPGRLIVAGLSARY